MLELLLDLDTVPTLAGTEQLIWKSTSTSALVGMFLKLMAVYCLSSGLLRLG